MNKTQKTIRVYFDNTSSWEAKQSIRNCDFYLEKIKKLNIDREFESLKAICTDGDIRPTMKYQWVATSTMLIGDDDPFEGIGSSPFEAIKNLYKAMTNFVENYNPEDYE